MKRAVVQRVRPDRLAGVLALVVLVACTPGTPPTDHAAVPEHVPERVASPAEEPLANLRGYYEARDGGLFTPCAETARRRIAHIGESDARTLAEAGTSSSDARFVAARGQLVDRDAVDIDAIEIIAGADWNCESRFDGFLYAARGTAEPWSLEVTPASITFTDEPGAPPLVLAYAPFVVTDDGRLFTAGDADARVRIALSDRRCVESLTGTRFPLEARVDVGERSYTGCAWRGEAER